VWPCRSFPTLAAVILAANAAHGAPVTFNTALPVGGGEFVARGLFIFGESGQDPSGADRRHKAFSSIAVLGYGVNHKLALFGVLPYVDKELDLTLMGSRVNRAASGLGDMSVFMRYTVVQWDRPGSTFRVAPFLGLKVPTGDSTRLDAIGSLPPSVQPGSGAWDVFGGVTMTYQKSEFQTDAQLSYRTKNESGGFDPGDEFRLDGSLQYRLWPQQLGEGVPKFLYGVLETNVVYRDRDQVNGSNDTNSGGTTVYLSPGLQWVTQRWIFEGVVQLPIAQNLHGEALENDYILRAGFRFNF
jgi:hypothetical protein